MPQMIRGTATFLLLALYAATPGLAQNDPYRFVEPSRNFYMDNFGECPHCKTLTVVVTEQASDGAVFRAFRRIADSLGKDHAGAVISREEMLVNYRVFKNLGCRPLTGYSTNIVVYVDRDQRYCEAIPYDNEDQLASLIQGAIAPAPATLGSSITTRTTRKALEVIRSPMLLEIVGCLALRIAVPG